MVHQYKNNGYNIVLDVCSGSVHVVDDLVYDIISLYEENDKEQIIEKLSQYDSADVSEAYDEVAQLVEDGTLFTDDVYKDYIIDFKKRKTVVKALCLHIAHDCNLACRYCFAGEGEYKGDRALMSLEVAKKSLDFLVANSGLRRNLEVDFFGGEPLMNWDVVKKTVEYGRSLEEKYDKKFRFTLTTNGVLLNDEIMEFANREMANVVLSIDGRKEVHDYMRPTRNGKGSYDVILSKFQEFAKKRAGKSYYVRGTYTHNNLDFSQDVLHMADLGFDQISVEPVVCDHNEKYALTEKELPAIFSEYERLAELMLINEKKGKHFNFFHFMLDLDQGPCAIKRLRGCGSGNEYVAITTEGDIYPCHQFAGITEFKMGNIHTGEFNMDMKKQFASAHIYTKEECKKCWAKFYCSGGCNANNYLYAGSILSPYKMSCEMMKKRLECAIMIKAAHAEEAAEEE